MKKANHRRLKITLATLLVVLGLTFKSCSPESVIETIDVIEEAIEEEAKLDNLNGEWIRIESNNPSSDGMIIEMSGTSGTIIDKRGSNFSVGDLKWKNIKAIDQENFEHEELGSDYNYYQASMLLQSDDTLRISVASSGSGNVQKWVREGLYTPEGGDGQGPTSTVTLDCNISAPLTLTNGPAAVDYLVDCVLDLTAALTIEPGTVIHFTENAGLGIYDEGTLNAVGTASAPIVFSGSSDLNGWWRGIHLETRSVNNKLINVNIENAGANYVYCCNEISSLFLKGAKVSLQNVTLSDGGGSGLVVVGDTEFDEYNNITINTHKNYPVQIAPEALAALDGQGSDYSGNEKDFVLVSDGSIATPTTWEALNVPYLLEGKVLDITQALTLTAGAELVFQENGGLGVYDSGSLRVSGTAANPVVMRGANPIRGFWRGVHLETTSLENSLDYLQLSDAGSNYVYCCNDFGSLFLKDGTASVTNSTFSNGESYGIVAGKDFEFTSYNNNTITTHTGAPMYLEAKTMGELDGLASSYTGNDKNYLLIKNSNVDEEITVQATNVPYRVEGNVVLDITARLNLQAGVEIEFEQNSGLGVYDNGIFNAIGTATQKIVFRGSEDSIGFWRGIHTETNSTSNIISNAEINNAGSNYVYCCNDRSALLVKGGQILVDNTFISKSAGCGITVKSGAILNEENNSYAENTDGNICN